MVFKPDRMWLWLRPERDLRVRYISLPDDLNRMNFDMCELIEIGATQIMTDTIADPSPWRPDYIVVCIVHRFQPGVYSIILLGQKNEPWICAVRPVTQSPKGCDVQLDGSDTVQITNYLYFIRVCT